MSREQLCRWRATDAGHRLTDEIVARLPAELGRPVSRALARRLIVVGAVRVGSVVEREPGAEVGRGDFVQVKVDLDKLPAKAPVATFDPRRVLYRDEWLLAVNKPPGLPTVPTADPSRPSLVSLLRSWLGGPNAYLGVHQRLDRDTSGVVLFTLQASANPALAAQFERREVHKLYEAIVVEPGSRRLPDEWTAKGPLPGPDGAANGPHAETLFRVKQRLPGRVVVEARPLTGRKHQIRIHLGTAGFPILGDERYGRAERGRRLMLHARQLSFAHPVSGKPIVVECPPPGDFVAASTEAPPRPEVPPAAPAPKRPAATDAAPPRRRGGPPRAGGRARPARPRR